MEVLEEVMEEIGSRRCSNEDFGLMNIKVLEINMGINLAAFIWTGTNFEICALDDSETIEIEKKHFARIRLFLSELLMKV